MTITQKIFLLGATGETGKPLLEQILENGHSVTAMVRDTNKICINHPKLTKITGDIFDPNVLAPIIKDHDVVVSVLGFPKQIDQPMTKFTDSMEAILKAMKMSKVQRIVTISAWYTNPNTRQGQYMFDNMWSKVPGLVNTLNNEGEMDQMLAKTETEVNFTSVLVPTLTWDPKSDKTVLVAENSTWVDGASGLMPREDVARFMLSVIENSEKWRRKFVAVSTDYTKEEAGSALERLMTKMNKK